MTGGQTDVGVLVKSIIICMAPPLSVSQVDRNTAILIGWLRLDKLSSALAEGESAN